MTGPAAVPALADDVEIQGLLARSHALGADRRVTNYGGGNTSCKLSTRDPATGASMEVLAVKGSGGDLGTLTFEGLALLDLTRLRATATAAGYDGPDDEDRMVELWPYCGFGGGGAAPSIDTPMHAFLPARHVDHLHPDAVIALATAADGETLTKECYGREVAWLPWRRPGFELGLQVQALQRDNPGLRGVVLGGHGLTAWGDTGDECRATSLGIIADAERFITARGRAEPFGDVRPGFDALSPAERRRRAAALAPILRGLCSTDRVMVGHYDDNAELLDFLARDAAPRLAALGTSCPDHFIRTRVRPLLLDTPSTETLAEVSARARELHATYRADYAAYYARFADADSPTMRGADPTVVLAPGVGMFTFGADVQTARVTGEFYVNAINVMRGAEALSRYVPIDDAEKFRIEYWSLEEAKLRRRPKAKPLSGRVALVTGAASGIGKAIAERLAAEGAAVLVADIDRDGAEQVAAALGGADAAIAAGGDLSSEADVVATLEDACIAFGGVDIVINNAGLSLSRSLVDTTVEDWDRQHQVMPRGSFLVSREAARVMIAQHLPGDIVYVVSKNAVVAGPDNVAYGAAKADQAHQVRLLAAELGPTGIRVNGVNPDGVVKGSGIFANGWGAERAKVYGVEEADLGQFYAGRTLLGHEVLPRHVADAVFVLLSGELSRTTGTVLPVDGGVPMAFLR